MNVYTVSAYCPSTSYGFVVVAQDIKAGLEVLRNHIAESDDAFCLKDAKGLCGELGPKDFDLVCKASSETLPSVTSAFFAYEA